MKTRLNICIMVSFMALSTFTILKCGGIASNKNGENNGPGDANWITAPTIVVTSPVRAEMLERGDMGVSQVTIIGEACDPMYPITRLEINGVDIPVSGEKLCEPFEVVQDSSWGLSIITGYVENSMGRSSTLAQSYLRSPSYFPFATDLDPAAEITSAAVVRLNQSGIDDSNRNDEDDLATAVWIKLNRMDLDAVIPNTIADTREWTVHECGFWPLEWLDASWHGYRVRKTGSFTYSHPTVDWLYAVDGGLFMGFSISNTDLPLWVGGWFNCACCGDYNASARGDVKTNYIWVETTISLSLEQTGLVSASICPTCFEIGFNGLWIDIDWGILEFMDSLLNEIFNAIVSIFQGHIEDLLAGQLREEIAPMVTDFINGMQFVFDDMYVYGIPLTVESSLDYFNANGPQGSGNCDLRMTMQAYPDNPNIEPLPIGAIRADGTLPSFSSTEYSFGAGLKDDVLNQLLWAAWVGGVFDIDDVTQFVPDNTLDGIYNLTITAPLPPVVMPSSSPGEIEIGMGDILVEADVDPVLLGNGSGSPIPVRLYVSGVMGYSLGFDTALNVLTGDVTSTQLWVQLEPVNAEIDEQAVIAAVSEAVEDVVISFFTASLGWQKFPDVGLSNVTVERQGQYSVVCGEMILDF